MSRSSNPSTSLAFTLGGILDKLQASWAVGNLPIRSRYADGQIPRRNGDRLNAQRQTWRTRFHQPAGGSPVQGFRRRLPVSLPPRRSQGSRDDRRAGSFLMPFSSLREPSPTPVTCAEIRRRSPAQAAPGPTHTINAGGTRVTTRQSAAGLAVFLAQNTYLRGSIPSLPTTARAVPGIATNRPAGGSPARRSGPGDGDRRAVERERTACLFRP